MSEKRESFYATYFEKDTILRLARWAGVLAWVVLGVYLFTSLNSLIQFLMQFATGVYYQKGMSIFDLVGFFTPYLTQPLPGLVYFFGLKFVEQALLIFMDMEESARRATRAGNQTS